MEDRLDLRLQPAGYDRLGDSVGDGGDGDFILPLLQTRVGMFPAGQACAGWTGSRVRLL